MIGDKGKKGGRGREGIKTPCQLYPGLFLFLCVCGLTYKPVSVVKAILFPCSGENNA